MQPRLVLASGSPRRAELLKRLGLGFTVRPADIDETPRAGESPAALVERLAREKAAAARPVPGEVAIAADTEVALDGTIFGKPRDDADAARMLRLLAGREHDVLTGVAVLSGGDGRIASGVERTRVAVAPMSAREIDWYVKSGEPRDKAGAYGIHGLFALFAVAVKGNYANVVGLPQPLFYRLASELGVDLLAQAGPRAADAAPRSLDSPPEAAIP
ncbi:MAG TPA: nucleoside triphosphate pyrophosphatase [Thermoanaerobaculia bacterium]|jgi:septum formation protein|nr:nucleoside triphosphate pyrophosphatase [Thermoanaerobaculia bacterium]